MEMSCTFDFEQANSPASLLYSLSPEKAAPSNAKDKEDHAKVSKLTPKRPLRKSGEEEARKQSPAITSKNRKRSGDDEEALAKR